MNFVLNFLKVQYKSIKSFHAFFKWILYHHHHHHHHQWLNVKKLTNNQLSRHHCRKQKKSIIRCLSCSFCFISFFYFQYLRRVCLSPYLFNVSFALFFNDWLVQSLYMCVFRQQIINWQICQANNQMRLILKYCGHTFLL